MSTNHASADVAPERDSALEVFLRERTRLFRIAYRVTGDPTTADDVVQEAWLRWQRVDRREVRNPAAFLATATTHLAINVIQSAHSRHELAAAPTDTEREADPAFDPAQIAERSDVATRIIALLLTRLTPLERAVYLLRRGLDYPYPRIAGLLGINIPYARQLARRAQANLKRRRNLPVSDDEHARLVAAFLRATRIGDLGPLERLLAQAAAGRPRSYALESRARRRGEETAAIKGVTPRAPTRSLVPASPASRSRQEDPAT
jgi:RNA polymerase sigma factor (sigma-70 family)